MPIPKTGHALPLCIVSSVVRSRATCVRACVQKRGTPDIMVMMILMLIMMIMLILLILLIMKIMMVMMMNSV